MDIKDVAGDSLMQDRDPRLEATAALSAIDHSDFIFNCADAHTYNVCFWLSVYYVRCLFS
jgi:hypothetical protein